MTKVELRALSAQVTRLLPGLVRVQITPGGYRNGPCYRYVRPI